MTFPTHYLMMVEGVGTESISYSTLQSAGPQEHSDQEIKQRVPLTPVAPSLGPPPVGCSFKVVDFGCVRKVTHVTDVY
jgi:hypothetical protein